MSEIAISPNKRLTPGNGNHDQSGSNNHASLSISSGGKQILASPAVDDYDSKTLLKSNGTSLIATLLGSIATSQVVYSNIATFLPPYRTVHHPHMSDVSVGMILA